MSAPDLHTPGAAPRAARTTSDHAHGSATPGADPFDPSLALAAPASLRAFNEAGVLSAADMHVAVTLCRLTGEDDPLVLLAAALGVRAPRFGHVFVDLERVAGTVTAEGDATVDLGALGWPDPAEWRRAVSASSLVAGDEGAPEEGTPDGRPLRLDGSRVYLDRYWRYERRVVTALTERGQTWADGVDTDVLREGLTRLYSPQPGVPPFAGDSGADPAKTDPAASERDRGADPVKTDPAASERDRGAPRLWADEDDGVDPPPPTEGDGPDLQRLAAATAVLRRLSVIAGGPGTGKTTIVAKVLALLEEQAAAQNARPPRVALAAPTGKAADRLEEAVHEHAGTLPVPSDVRERLAALSASTIHRLLRSQPGSRSRFRHDRSNPLPHDVVIIDETSMLSLALMAKLLDAVRPTARLVLVGDPEQLASVEAGAVLGDIVGPATAAMRMPVGVREALERVTGEAVPATEPPPGARVADGIVVMRRMYRFAGASGIAALADAIQRGDPDGVLDVLEGEADDLTWVETDGAADPAHSDEQASRPVRASGTAGDRTAGRVTGGPEADGPVGGRTPGRATGRPEADGPVGGRASGRAIGGARADGDGSLAPVRAAVSTAGALLHRAARDGNAQAALAALQGVRVLCAHRRGQAGAATWVRLVERWLTDDVAGYDPRRPWYLGRPVLVTRNDYQLGVFNGDAGVVIDDGDGQAVVVFSDGDGVRRVSPSRLEAVETCHAMTVHKSQGSQFRDVVVVLPDATSPILTRELLYTAVTRARRAVTVVGSAEAIRAAVTRPIERASGLRDALWPEPPSV